MLITIYDKAGNPKVELSPNDSSTQATEIQGDSVLTLSFTHYGHIDLDVDDYADFEGERYWLTEKYRPKQKSMKEWSYDIRLYGVESMIKRLLVIKTVDNEEEPVFTLTAPPREHVAMIVKCMNAGMGNITDWKVGQVDGAENIVIDYFGKYCDQALKEIAEKAGAEWWVEGQTVNICKCEHGEPVSMGYDKGLTCIEPGTADNVKFYTRLYPVGSSRNIDREKYGSTRLRLPGDQKYVEMNADKYGRVDHYEADAFADIYPRRVGVVSSVRSEVRTGEDGKPFTIYYFRDDSLPFDPNDYEIGGLVKRVSFQEGSELAGLGDEEDGTYYFEVNYNSDAREFEIITIWPYDDDTQLPGGALVPKEGDKYILWNLRMPDEYYTLAEEEFLAAVSKYNAEHNLDLTVYKASTDHVWIEDNNVELTIGRRVRLESEEYFPGTGYRDSRITRISRKVNLPSQMDLEIGDALSRTAMSTMSDSIESVRSYARTMAESISLPDIIRTGDMTRATDNNLLSALRSYRDLVRKDRDDRSPHKIASDQGFEIGRYLAGVSGGMLGIDKTDGQSFADVFKLWVRGKAYFETLTIIEAATLAGKQYITPGGAIKCTKVEEVKNTAGVVTAYRCYFLSEQDGEKTETKIIAGDQAISEMFNAKTGTTNKVSNHRYWRLVTSVNNDAYTDDAGNHYGYIDLSAMDCEAYSDIPQSGDVIDHLGNRTDRTRQAAMIFSTVDPDSPSIKLLTGIDHYTLTGKDIISQGYDHVKGHAYMRCHGDVYIGDPDGSTFVKYDRDANHMDINAALSVNCLLGGQTFEEWLLGYGYTDDTALNDFIADYQNDIADIQTQIDGKAETWYQATDPSTVARPNGWLGESGAEHKGDLWYKTTDGTTWYWNGTAWERQDVPDSVFDAIDGKADIFVIKPTAYHKNDLWFLESDYVLAGNKWYDAGTLVVATQDSTVWNSAHWTKKDRYTDDTLAQTAIDSIADYEYLKTAIVDGASQAIGGLFLSSYIKLGTWNKSNPDKPVFDTPWSGLNGVYVNGRTPSYFAGGDMIDRFDAQDNMLNVAGRRYATSMVRMDGSAYFLDGKVQFKSNGTAQFGLDSSAVTIDGAGHLTLGNGISINIGGEAKGLGDSIASVTNLANKLANLFIPYIDNSAKTWGEISDISTVTSVKVRTGIWTDSFVSARGLNGNGGGSGGGTGKSYLSDLLDVQLGALTAGQYLMWNGTKWVNTALTTPDMSGYALESWVTANYQPKGSYVTLDTAQTITGAKTFMADVVIASEHSFVTCQPRKAAGNGGWAHNHFQVNDSQGSPFLNIGAYGNAAQLDWIYIGSGNFNSNSNLRISPTGFATAAGFIRYGGTSSQVLMADGSVQPHWKAASISTATSDEGMLTPLGMNNWVSANFYRKTDSDSRYVKKAGDTMTGLLTISANTTQLLKIAGTTQGSYIQFGNGGVGAEVGYFDGLGAYIENDNLSNRPLLCLDTNDINSAKFVYNNTKYKLWHSGNDGSGSGLDADLLDGVHLDSVRGYRVNHPAINSALSVGNVPFNAFGMQHGTPLYNDPEFARGTNDVNVYNNLKNGNVTITRIADNQASANSSGYILQIKVTGAASPGIGGFYQDMQSRANAVFMQIFRAKIPVGYEVGTYSNNMGNGRSDVWITSTAGTGKWEWYARVTYCGASGTFSTGGHVALSGATPTTSAPLYWYLSHCQTWDLTKNNYGAFRAKFADALSTARTINGTSFDGTANITTANWGTARNIGIVSSDGTGTAVPVSVNGSGNVNLKLPATIKAALSGNASTATKLQTARTIWGQSFDGTGNVSGNMTGVGTIYNSTNSAPYLRVASTPTNAGNLGTAVGLGNAPDNYGLFIWSEGTGKGHIQVGRKDGSNTAYNLILQEFGGNVGVGIASPSYKLDVNGFVMARSGIHIGTTADIGWYLNSARLAAGNYAARGVNVGSLLVSNAWADATKVPANGIYSKGAVRIGDCTISWDSAHGMLKFDKGLYSEGGVSARGINANAGGGTGGGATSLSALTDVQLGTLTSGQFLKWNGAKWTNATIAMPSLAGYAQKSWVNANFLPYTALDDDGELGGTFLKIDGSNATSSTLPELSVCLPAYPTIAIADTDMFFISRSSGGVMCGALSIWNYIRPKIQNGGFSIGTLATPVDTMYVDSISSGTDSGELPISCAGNASQLTLYSNGNVGIGTESKALYRLEVEGEAGFSGTVSATSYAQKSDARLKTVLGDAGIKVADIAAAPAVRFTWNKTGVAALGTTAQYWRTVAPELAPVLPDGTLGMNYGVAALLSAVSLARMTLDHEERIAELERENGELRQQIAELQTK